jgi:hypothetical protein
MNYTNRLPILKKGNKNLKMSKNYPTFVATVPAKPLYNAQIGRSSFFIGLGNSSINL